MVDGEEKQMTQTVAKMSCEMRGVEGVKGERGRGRGRGKGRGRGRGRGRGKCVVRVEERSPGAGRRRGKRRGRDDPVPITQQPDSPTHLGESYLVTASD